MSSVFVAVNGDGVGEAVGNAIINDNHDELSRVSNSIKTAHQMLDAWVEGQGGKVVVSSGDEAIYHLPQHAVTALNALRSKYQKMANTTLTVGIGSTMSEASKALIFGKMNNKNQIVQYDPSIDSQISGADGEDEDSLPSPDGLESEGEQSAFEQQGGEGQAEGEEEDDGANPEGSEEEGFGQEEEDADAEEGQPNIGKDVAAKGKVPQGKPGQPGQPAPKEKAITNDGSNQLSQADADEAGADTQNNFAPAAKKPAAPGQQQVPPQAQGKPGAKKPAPQAPMSEDDEEATLDNQGQQPPHEQNLSPEEQQAHDAEENQDDEEDTDNIEADEEEAEFGGNTEPLDDDFEEDAEESAENQDIDDADAPFNAQAGAEEEDYDAENDEAGAEADLDASSNELENGDVSNEELDEGAPEMDENGNPVSDMGEDEQDGVMSEMMHANMGDEEEEDSDDEIKQDIIECLMSFKQNKLHLEELKNTNPEMYQANLLMLRSMIQMAKKLKMNPEAAMADATNSQDFQQGFPSATGEDVDNDGIDDGEDDINNQAKPNMLGKSEKDVKGVHKPYMGPGESFAGELSREGKRKPGKFGEQNKEVARSFHKQKIKELKNIKPNLPKSEDMTKAENKTRNIWHPTKMKQGDSVHFEGTHYKVHSQRSDAQPSAKTKKPRYYTTIIPHKESNVQKSKVEDMKIDIKKEKTSVKKR